MIVGLRFRRISSLFGMILKWFSLVFVPPILFALTNGTPTVPFVLPLMFSLLLGFLLERKYTDLELEVRDGFLLVALTWVTVTLLGTFPYVLLGIGSLADPFNAFFESTSGFTATGSTAMVDISLARYPHSIMFWRQMSQWLGGMGVLVLAVAILPRLSVGGAQFLDSEVPGPRMERLTPHMAETARHIWAIYIGLSILLFTLLFLFHGLGWAPKMNAFQAISHVFTTVSCAGFSPQAESLQAFQPAVQWLILPFIVLSAVNITLFWQTLFVDRWSLFRDTEVKIYLWTCLFGGLILSYLLWAHEQFPTLEEILRHGFFQVATIITTTGYASTDFALWDGQALMILFLLMFIGGCAGSPSGSIKVMRWIIGLKAILREIFQMIHPYSVRPMRLSRRIIKEPIVQGIMVLLVLYILLFSTGCIFVSLDAERVGLDLEFVDVMSAVSATLLNVGPGFGAVGPMENFAFLPRPTKFLLSIFMIAGRLEVMTFFVVFSPAYWRD